MLDMPRMKTTESDREKSVKPVAWSGASKGANRPLLPGENLWSKPCAK